jgi:hypothetical protein
MFSFDRWVYVHSDAGLFVQLYNAPCFGWQQVPVPAGAESIEPVGNYLYAGGSDLWWAGLGGYPNQPSWNKVTSTGVPSGATIRPRAQFQGQLYAEVVTSPGAFDVYRTPDIGQTSMAWTQVVSAGFGEPLNHELGCLIEYNGTLIAVTSNTRTEFDAAFGDQWHYGTGVEVWQSSTGDLDSWTQVNLDGFNTEATIEADQITIRTNQDLASAVVYDGYLYVGTRAHAWHSGEVWRYDGSGLSGWTAVTPQGMCSGGVGCGGPSRAADMVVYEGLLYLAEGYPTGNLETFDGTAWTIVAPRPPFDPANDGIYSLAVLPSRPTPSGGSTGDKLFALTSGMQHAVQIWSYPFPAMPPTCADLGQATIAVTPKTAQSELFPGATHTFTVTIDAAAGFDFSQVWVPLSTCVNQTYYQDGGSTNCADGWVYDNGVMTETYAASFLGPLPPLGAPDQIEACFANLEGLWCDSATHSWVDTIAPTITITTPAEGATYTLNQVVAADYSVQDGAGVLSTTAPVPVGGAIPTSQAGSRTFTGTAGDYAGNTAPRSVTYQVLSPLQGIQLLRSEVLRSSTPPGIKIGLNAKLTAATGSLARGNKKAAVNNLNAFINMVNAQRGKKIPRALASSWVTGAQNIIRSIST